MLWSSVNISLSSNSFLLYTPGCHFPRLFLAASPEMNIRYTYGTESVMNSGVTFSYHSICGCGWYSLWFGWSFPCLQCPSLLLCGYSGLSRWWGSLFLPHLWGEVLVWEWKTEVTNWKPMQWPRCFNERNVPPFMKKWNHEWYDWCAKILFILSNAWILQWLIIICAFCAVPFLL